MALAAVSAIPCAAALVLGGAISREDCLLCDANQIPALAAGLIAQPWARTALRRRAVALAVLLFLLSLRRAGERAGRVAERLETMEKTDEVHRRMLEAAARRPHGRDEPARRLRDGQF